MAEDVLKLILTTEQTGNFRQWFVNFFQNEETLKCTIEEFAVFFLNFIRNQTEEYMKNNASSCNTPRKSQSSSTCARTARQSASSTNQFASKSQQPTSGTDNSNHSNKSISRDLFATSSDSTGPVKLKMHDLMNSPQLSTNNDNKSPFSMDCNNFTSDLNTPSPQPMAIRRLSAAETNASYHTPNKSASSIIITSTPSFKPNNSQHNRTGDSNSRHSMSMRSNDSRSFDDSIHLDTSIGPKQSHEKSRDRRNHTGSNSSTLCLGDFLTISTSKHHSQKARKSFNSFEQSATHSPDTVIGMTPKSNNNNHKTKPKKRVVPTRIGTNSDEFNCPAFRSDNNILDVSQEECANSARDLLKSQKDMIRRVFQEERPHQTTSLRAFLQENIQHDAKQQSPIEQKKPMPPLNLKQVTNKILLDKFINIYSTIIDLNLITNILTEFSFLVNLINVDIDEYYDRNPHMMIESIALKEINADDGEQCVSAQSEPKRIEQHYQQEQHQVHFQSKNLNVVGLNINTLALTILKNINNCVYFGLGVLQLQCSILRLLDITSIKVLLENERLTSLNVTIKDDLMKVYSHKIQLEQSLRIGHYTSHGVSSSILNVAPNGNIKVFYQQEQDTQMNFPSTQEFAAFKKQRDNFYSILETWETKHLNPMWDFETELGRRVRSMLNLMDHPINMAHMAKLFTSQLNLSCNFNDIIQSEMQSDLPNIDPTKLNKLRQRLIEPGDFSTNYQFPGQQIFFKDFIVAAQDHTIFIEQLKIILTNELIDMDNSSYETLNLSTIDENDHENRHEYIVRPETLSTLSVLAKFLGLIMARPFIYEFGVNTTVDNRQIELRNKIRTPIDIKAILEKSIANQKLIVTLPWVVQFISMLDPISLRSEYYCDVFHMFYELYIMTTDYQSNSIISLRPTSVFIIRSCLGWLFDQQNVPNEYYSYRQIRNPMTTILPGHPQKVEFIAVDVQVFVPESVVPFFRSNNHQFVLNADYKHDSAHKLSGTFEQLTIDRYASIGKMTLDHQNESGTMTNDNTDSALKKFDPLLESILHAACPFLADFRVSIMPRRNSKVVSRTGRLRHITPKIYQTSSPNTSTAVQSKTSPGPPTIKSNQTTTAGDTQTKLFDAFLHSQSLSVRRTVEFIQERVYSAVIKDFQVGTLLPFKKSIVESIDAIQLNDSQAILNELYRIYANGEQFLLNLWQQFVASAALERVKQALDALLPHETVDAVKLTCINIAVQRALARINDWRTTNLKGIEIFTKDIQVDVEKVLKNTQSMQSQMENTLTINLMECPPWKVFDRLQCKLHQLSMFPEQVQSNDIDKLLTEIRNCIVHHVLPDSMHKTIGTTAVYLLLLLISNRPELVNESTIERFVEIWKMKQFTIFVQPPSVVATQSDRQSQNNDRTNDTSDAITNTDATTVDAESLKRLDTTYIFSVILSPVNVFAQQNKPAIHFEKLADLIITLIKNRLMNMDFLNEQFTNLSQMEWVSSAALDKVAITMQCVMDSCGNTIASQIDDSIRANELN